MAEDNRNALFNQVKGFSQRNLNKVETKVVSAHGEVLTEKRTAKGLLAKEDEQKDEKKDLQVGFVIPNLFIASNDVAGDQETLKMFGITHILSLVPGIEDTSGLSYKCVNVEDDSNFVLKDVFDECFQFIDEARKAGNVLVHCEGTTCLSRSTSICIGYLMKKENMKYIDALNAVKEARPFVRPNEGFTKQLKEYESQLIGTSMKKIGMQ